MSQITLVSATGSDTTHLISDSLLMLNGITLSGQITGLAIHDVATTAGVAASNKIYSITGDFMQTPFTESFEGVMFHSGMVIVLTFSETAHTGTANVEWE